MSSYCRACVQEINETQLASLTCLTDTDVATVTEEVDAVRLQAEEEAARHVQARAGCGSSSTHGTGAPGLHAC